MLQAISNSCIKNNLSFESINYQHNLKDNIRKNYQIDYFHLLSFIYILILN